MEELDYKIQGVLKNLGQIKGFLDYFHSKSSDKELSSPEEIYKIVQDFPITSLNKDEADRFNFLSRYLVELGDQKNDERKSFKIFNINFSLRIKEDFIDDFLAEFNKFEGVVMEEVQQRRYKTIKEYIAQLQISENNIDSVYDKFLHYRHPFISYLISEAVLNAKDFSKGVPILGEALKYAMKYPNIYWHNLYGVEGCAWSLFQVQYFLGNEGMCKVAERIENFRIRLFKLIYLYASRYIYMSKEDVKSMDFYTNRARLAIENQLEFSVIFGELGINPEVQFISDFYVAHMIGEKYGVNNLLYRANLMQESLKMYRHGSHVPNATGGYKEIEEETWIGIVNKGKLRGPILADKLLREFETGSLNFTNSEVELICNSIIEKFKGKLK